MPPYKVPRRAAGDQRPDGKIGGLYGGRWLDIALRPSSWTQTTTTAIAVHNHGEGIVVITR